MEYIEIFKTILTTRKLTQVALANVLNLSTAKINKLVSNEKDLSLEIYDEIKVVLGLNHSEIELLAPYVKHLEKERNARRDLAIIYQHIDLSVLKKEAIINNIKDPIECLNKILKYFGVEDINHFNKKVPKEISNVIALCRKWQKDTIEPSSANLYIFLKKCRDYVNKDKVELPDFNKEKLIALTSVANTFTLKDKGLILFVDELLKCGVRVIEQNHLPKTYLNGITFLHEKNPVIALTYRLKNNDNLWFTLLHEIAHVINDYDLLKENSYLIHEEDFSSKIEERAEEFARKTFKIPEILKDANIIKRMYGVITVDNIDYLSDKYVIGKDLVLGSLQYAKIVGYSENYNLKYKAPHLCKEG